MAKTGKRTYRDGEVVTGPVTDVHGTVWTSATIEEHLAEVYGRPRRDRKGRFAKRGPLARIRARRR